MAAKKKETAPEEGREEKIAEETPEAEVVETPAAPEAEVLPTADELLRAEKEKYLRLAAEYDNYRKRSQKEREALYTDIRVSTVNEFLPVYDNLERALRQETADEAFKQGVEMTMQGFTACLEKLGVHVFGDVGEAFDPNIHNAIMHCEDETLGENVIAEVFQRGFILGERVIRFAMVKVAN